jgi:hypothetical protein
VLVIGFALASGCISQSGNVTPSLPTPTITEQIPVQTSTVSNGFCGPNDVSHGLSDNGVYVYTDKDVYQIGEVVQLGIFNCGVGKVDIVNYGWRIDKKENGIFLPYGELIGKFPAAPIDLDPGEYLPGAWDTGNQGRGDGIYLVGPLQSGEYRVTFPAMMDDSMDRVFGKEFTLIDNISVCRVPDYFCGPSNVCAGEPVAGVYAYTNKNVFIIGEEPIKFGVANCGNDTVLFGNLRQWFIQKKLDGNWVVYFNNTYAETAGFELKPCENSDTYTLINSWSDEKAEPGEYRVVFPVYPNQVSKEFILGRS